MSAEHDIESINAALALGDRFVPPNGSVVCWDDSLHWMVGAATRDTRGLWVEINLGTTFYGSSYSVEGELPVVVSVPSTAPPFSEWERL